MARHDIRDPVSGKFGKRLITATHASDAYPAVTERRTNRRVTPESKFGSNNPDLPASKNLVLTGKQALVGDDNSEVRTDSYETLPGPALPTTTISRDTEGGLQVTTTQDVLLADTPAPKEPLPFGINSVSLQATDCIKGTLTTVTQDHPPRTGQIVNDATLGSVGTVTIQTVPAGTPALPPALNLISSEEEPTDTGHAVRTDTQVQSWPVLTTYENTRIGRQITLIPAKFLGEDELTIVRTKVEPGTPPDAISTTILSSIVTQEAEGRSEKVNVTRPDKPYPILNGSEMSTAAGGVVATISDQTVTAGTPAASGFLVLSSTSEPIDQFYNELRTTSVSSFPELVGAEFSSNIPEKFTAGFALETDEDWVDTTTSTPSSYLVTSAGAISCKVVPETNDRGKRTTVKLPSGAVLPTLTDLRKNSRGQLETVVLNVGTALTLPALAATQTVLSLEEISDGLFLRTVGTIPGFALLQGQAFDGRIGVAEEYTERDMSVADAATYLGQANTTVTPVDELTSRVRIELSTVLTTFLESYALTLPRVNLPDVLVGYAVEMNAGGGDGYSIETGSTSESGGGTLNLNIPNSSQGSQTLLPEVTPLIQSVYGDSLPVIDYVFFVPVSSTATSTLAHLSGLLSQTVHPWPSFQPLSHTIACKGQKVSVRATATVRMSIYLGQNSNSSAISEGVSQDYDVSTSTRVSTFKPTIHGALTLTGSPTASATAFAPATAFIAGIGAAGTGVSKTAYASVSPATLAATPGVNQIPSSGLYVYRLDSQRYKNGMSMVRAQVLDFANVPVGAVTLDASTTYSLHNDLATITGGFTQPPNASTPSSFSATAVPQITAQPQSKTAPTGSSVTLSVAATGAYPVTYQWYFSSADHSNNPINDGSVWTGTATDTLNIASFNGTADVDAGNYTVVVTNNNGSVTSATAVLTAGPQIAITAQPVSASASDGQSVTFSVTATGNNLTYQWLKGGQVIDGSVNTSALTASYTIASVTDDDAGSYSVAISDGTPADTVTSAPVTLTIIPALTVTTAPASQTMHSDGAIQLTSTATGTANDHHPGGALGATWYRNGVAVLATFQAISNVPSTVNGVAVSTTTTTQIIGHDFTGVSAGGSYYVKFTDGNGNTVQSAAAVITVDNTLTSDISITTQPQAIALAGTSYTGTFSITATGGTSLFYQWLTNTGTGAPSESTSVSVSPSTPTFAFGSTNGHNDAAVCCLVFDANGTVTSSIASLKQYILSFISPTANQSVTSTSSTPVQLNIYHAVDGGGMDVSFAVSLSQLCSDGSAAHGSFSTSTFTTTSSNRTPISNYTPSASDAGKDVNITATLAFSSGPVTGIIGSVSDTVHVAS